MQEKTLPDDIIQRIHTLEEKYAAMGQDMRSYLDGLIHSDYLTYWDYTHLDVLLSLQNPRTIFPDEKIFILYHQITELYFKLILNEIEQLAFTDELHGAVFKLRMKRINNYFRHLTDSFSIMIDGMEKEQFLQFRMALLPASGFQSAQYRMIEMTSTDAHNLVAWSQREGFRSENDYQVLLDNLYWQRGGRELASGRKTLTLRQFLAKYSKTFLELMDRYRGHHLLARYKQLPEQERDEELTNMLRDYDHLANVAWPLVHLKSAARYLNRDPDVIAATGGTNWQKYLPPNQQQLVFFPELWTERQIREWGT
ncbi:MAG: tryptophan 2,3-dioxygenase [Bacteroidetes bacterium]|nr:tryptophan 2,3-dioxygenase [Bacteroidota bacterium]